MTSGGDIPRGRGRVGRGRAGVGERAGPRFSETAEGEEKTHEALLDELRVLARGRTGTADLPPDTEARRAYAWLAGEAGHEARPDEH